MEQKHACEAVFRFLDLPREIQDMIYRYLLLSKYVTKWSPNPRFYNWSGGTSLLGLSLRARSHGDDPGALHCQNAWIETSFYNIALLRVNHQLHEEAFEIFHNENKWLIVRFGRLGIAQGLVAAAFDLFFCRQEPLIGGEKLYLRVDFLQRTSVDNEEVILMSIESAVQLPGHC